MVDIEDITSLYDDIMNSYEYLIINDYEDLVLLSTWCKKFLKKAYNFLELYGNSNNSLGSIIDKIISIRKIMDKCGRNILDLEIKAIEHRMSRRKSRKL